MNDLTPDDVRRWDAAAVLKVFQVANARAGTLQTFGEDLGQVGGMLAEWDGEAGEAFHRSLGKLRTDIGADGRESANVGAAVSTSWEDVQICKAMMNEIDERAEALGFTITDDWKVSVGDNPLLLDPAEAEAQRQLLQQDLDTLNTKAHATDHELAAAMRAAVGDAQLDSSGRQIPQAAGQQGPEQPPAPDGPVDPAPIPLGQVTYDNTGNFASGPAATRGYISQALDQLGITDPNARARWTEGYLTMSDHESSFNPFAINNDDINARPPNSTYKVSDGYGNGCSRGVVQCVPGTFARWHQPGTSKNIYDPVANIAASMNYVMGDYGVSRDASNLKALIPQANPGVHRGY